MVRALNKVLGVGTAILCLGFLYIWPIETWLHRATLLMLVSMKVFTAPREDRKGLLWSIWNIVVILLCLSWYVYIYLERGAMAYRTGVAPEPLDVVFGTFAIISTIELTRRLSGNSIPILALCFMAFARIGNLPGIFAHKAYSFSRMISFIFSTSGLFSELVGSACTYVIAFVALSSFLNASGAGEFFTDIAMAVAGKQYGGPAKIATIGSSLFGMISGSSVGNVVTTGAFSIPLMKSAGFEPHYAGAVEAVASTGGQIVPPVLGVAAFVMAEVTGIPYSRLAISASLPALLYYAGVYFAVDFYSRRRNLIGLSESIPKVSEVLRKNGHLAIPPAVLIYSLMVAKITPMRAAFYTLLALVVVSLATGKKGKNRISLMSSINALDATTSSTAEVAATCATAGIIVGMLNLTGLGLGLGTMLINLAGGSMLGLLVAAAILCLILGMGMPTVGAYVITAAVVAPALESQGLSTLAVHLFVFYFACLSSITPPVALAAYAAAGLAKANPWMVGYTAVRLGLPAFIVPFMFIFGPQLLLEGAPLEVVQAVITSMVGVCCLAGATEGYWVRFQTSMIGRIALFIAAFLLIDPGLATDLVGLALIAIAVVSRVRQTGVTKAKEA